VVLKGGLVIDGHGRPAFAADVALSGDTITAVGDLTKVAADQVIDVTGLAVAPGFIDVHTHDDLICITQPDMTPKISQGVTTLIVGNCGISAPPLRFSESVSEPFNLLGKKDDFAYDTFAGYRRAIETVSPRVNVAALVGHSTLRMRCVEDLGRPATASEREKMNALLAEALDHGALGMSSGVFYAPAQAADVEELQVLAQTVGKAGGVCTAHIRDERDGIVEALQEAFAVT
jgi:N-acyl-D-amino-acid deacylase